MERPAASINAYEFLYLSMLVIFANLLRIPSNIERPAARINAYLPSSGGSAIESAATAYLAFSKRSSLVSTFVCGRHTLGHCGLLAARVTCENVV